MMIENILITGGSGFLGSHLIRYFLAKGYRILAYRRKTADLWRLNDIMDLIQWYDIESLDDPFKDFKIDHVIHAATCYGTNNENALEVLDVNLLFPLKLFYKAMQYHVKTFFNTDTYLNKSDSFYDYLASYVLSKKQLSNWLRHLTSRANLPAKVKVFNVYLEHVYGSYDKDEKFVSQIIKQCVRNVSEIRLTEGKQKRDFVYIDDVLDAYFCLVNNYHKLPECFNVCSIGRGVAVTVREFVETVAQITQTSAKLLFGALPYRRNEIMESVANDATLILFGWEPKYDVTMGVQAILQKM